MDEIEEEEKEDHEEEGGERRRRLRRKRDKGGGGGQEARGMRRTRSCQARWSLRCFVVLFSVSLAL